MDAYKIEDCINKFTHSREYGYIDVYAAGQGWTPHPDPFFIKMGKIFANRRRLDVLDK